ncbi:MAG: cupin domain-containing protein [Halodesulfurarchaeum sp.]
MGYQTASTDDVESVIDPEWGGMWFLKDPLETDEVGVTVMELEPGGKGKEHDHTHDGQEEVYLCIQGTVEVDLESETVPLAPDEAIRLDAAETRQIHNRGDKRAKLVLVGAPI